METLLWATVGGLCAFGSTNIVFHFWKPVHRRRAIAGWCVVGIVAGALRGYTGKTIAELVWQ